MLLACERGAAGTETEVRPQSGYVEDRYGMVLVRAGKPADQWKILLHSGNEMAGNWCPPGSTAKGRRSSSSDVASDR